MKKSMKKLLSLVMVIAALAALTSRLSPPTPW